MNHNMGKVLLALVVGLVGLGIKFLPIILAILCACVTVWIVRNKTKRFLTG